MAIGTTKFNTGVDTSAPLKTLYHSHDSLVTGLGELAELPLLVVQAQRSRQLAASALERFRRDLLEHHADEERELFPAVVASAQPGEEHDRVQSLVRQLVAEHREVERMWEALEPAVEAAAKGRCQWLDAELLQRLVHRYSQHARFEESHFLPLAQAILARDANHLGALGVALHMRRVPPFPGHI